MHAHDRTLLSRLGFNDPDKRDERHDLVCQFLALPENHERLVRMIDPPKTEEIDGRLRFLEDGVRFVGTVSEDLRISQAGFSRPHLEAAITKGFRAVRKHHWFP